MRAFVPKLLVYNFYKGWTV